MKLKGKHVLITGATSGIGLALAKKLNAEQAQVTITGRRDSALNQVKTKLKSVNTLNFDITDYQAVTKSISTLDHIDILINNAGIWQEGPFSAISQHQIDNTIRTNLNGLIYVTQAALPKFDPNKPGFIVNVSSTLGLRGQTNHTLYCASKWGVRGFSEALKDELKTTHIKVLTLFPGGVDTHLFRNLDTAKDTSSYMSPDAVAEVVVFALQADDSLILDQLIVNRYKR